MLILALDTATDTGSLALVEDEEPLWESSLEGAGAYLSRLLPRLAALFAAAGRVPADLGAIGVSVGPGNFTGLRIGCATAKTLAWSLGCPLVPVPTLEVLAAQVPFQPRRIGVVRTPRGARSTGACTAARQTSPWLRPDPSACPWPNSTAV